VTQALSGHSATGRSYLLWQLLRPPNHGWEFYAVTVAPAIGLLMLLAAAVGAWVWRPRSGWREVLLVCWVAAPVVAFELWPVKGFQYLLPITPAVAVLAARGVLGVPSLRRRWATVVPGGIRTIAAAVIIASLLVVTVPAVFSTGRSQFLAGTGGVPGGRETGLWIRDNTPAGATVMTLGPSMANIVQYYGHRRAYGLSVSTNPLRRNPSYQPIVNPDRRLRQADIQYVVWDAFSAARSPHFSNYLMQLTERYHGRVVHTEFVSGTDESGQPTQVPVMVVYEVRP
jgi:4-amino-4-deoxy-L-arabinose transferase-like glycosyltransferase